MLGSTGSLRIRAYTAGGALPVVGATVRIRGAEEANRLVNYSLTTDRDGITESVSLPAPSVEYSLSPDPVESPFALYDVEIVAPGYYSKTIKGLTVFSGVESIQLVNMIPGDAGNTENYPRGNINTVITENEI